ncbi:TlpA disulfide reductase family protein [Pikeienuella sp. HZG-20]|uniref:TlpA family protein disulfide reductase n=1 Tax=Paludibacillus litoralis TaxID=3133267 RepID=UPI0030ED7AF2
MRIVLIFIGLAACLAAGQAALKHFGPPEGGLFEERVIRITRESPAPETRLVNANGGVATLADWRGEVAVVALWATWCPICAREMPQLQALAERYQGRGLSVVTVSLDDPPAEALVRDYLSGRGYDLLPPFIDPDRALASSIGLRGTPTTMIVDKFGQVVAVMEGLGPWRDAATDRYLDALIAAPDADASRALLSSSASAGS